MKNSLRDKTANDQAFHTHGSNVEWFSNTNIGGVMAKKANVILNSAPECPTFLDGIAADHWKAIMPLLVKDKVVCSIDIPILMMACQCYAMSQTAEKIGDKFRAQNQYISILSKFGATYKSRIQLEMDTKSKPASKETLDADVFEDFE